MIDIKERIPEGVLAFGKRVAFEADVHKPDILFAVGIAAVIGGAVLAGLGTLKAKDGLEALDDGETADEDETPKNGESEDAPELAKTDKERRLEAAKVVAKAYSPAVACLGTGILLLAGAHGVQASRLVAATSSYNAMLAAFNAYRAKVVEEEGFEKDALYSGQAEKLEETVTTKAGKEKTVVRLRATELEDPYHIIFDSRCREWESEDRMPGYNMAWLEMQRNCFQQAFERDGYLLLTDVYKAFGYDFTKFGGDVVTLGWHMDCPTNDGYIDFGLRDWAQLGKQDFEDLLVGNIHVAFNADGDIREWL